MSADKKSLKSTHIEDAFKNVPEIGTIYTRWYDIPYKILRWIVRGGKQSRIPKFIKPHIYTWMNILHQYNSHDRHIAWNKDDETDNLHPSTDEHFNMPSIFVVELFTPNEIANLEKAIKHNKWNGRVYAYKKSNSEMLKQSRAKNGMSWWQLADIVNGAQNFYIHDAQTEKLPVEFNWIHLKAIQIGSGLTAVVARFTLSPEYVTDLDQIIHKEHEPILDKSRKGRPYPMNRLFSAYKNIQTRRNDLHELAREWMAKNCQGYFAMHKEKQVSLDVLITEKFNPTSTSKKPPDSSLHDVLRGLGIDAFDTYRITSPQMPNVILSQADSLAEPHIYTSRTWGVMGNVHLLKKSTNNFQYYGGDPLWGMTAILDDRIGHILPLLAISELLASLEAQNSKLRDSAKLQYGKFTVKGINNLNRIVLDASLTLASIKRDIESLQKYKWWFNETKFIVKVSPHLKDKISRKPFDLVEDLLKRQSASIQRLDQIDKDYRDILTTVSSLGSTANNIKLGRWALFVSIVSLIVAMVTLLVSQPTNTTTPTHQTSEISQN